LIDGPIEYQFDVTDVLDIILICWNSSLLCYVIMLYSGAFYGAQCGRWW